MRPLASLLLLALPALAAPPSAPTTSAAAHLDRMTKLADVVARHVDAGLAPSAERDAARYYVAEAQLWAR